MATAPWPGGDGSATEQSTSRPSGAHEGGSTPPPEGPTGPSAGQPERLQPAGDAATTEQLMRALADLDNLRKRFDRELASAVAAERDRAAGELNSVVDDLDRALAHAGAQADPESVLGGIRVVRDRALGSLASLGYRRFGETGERFDPERHEAVGSTPAVDAPPGTVVSVVRAGYERDGRVVRPAAVIVAT